MSQLAREHPEDDRYQSLEGQREVLAERADQARQERKDNPSCTVCNGDGYYFTPGGAAEYPCPGCSERPDLYEGPHRAHQDREERRYGLTGPSDEERRSMGDQD